MVEEKREELRLREKGGYMVDIWKICGIAGKKNLRYLGDISKVLVSK